MGEYQYSFSERFRRLRLDKDVSCAEIAKSTGLSATAIHCYEDIANFQSPKLESLVKIAEYFDVSVDYLIGRTDLRRLPTTEQLTKIEKNLLDLGALTEGLREDLSKRDGI